LDEIFEITDRITVFRDGKYIATKMTPETTHDELVSMMVGKDIHDLYPERKVALAKEAAAVLRVEQANDHQKIHDVSFEVKSGEIVGIAGLLGSGNIRIGKLISGYYGGFDGQVEINGKAVQIHTPGDALEAGISCVSDDRKIEGLVLIRSVKENISLASLHRLLKKRIFSSIDKAKENQVVDHQIERLNIKVSSSDQIAGNLSGGNQQKVVFGKMLETTPQLLILNEPTRGIDIGAKAEIYQIMRELSEQGIGIILASSELPELIGMSDRALVMREGKIVKELMHEDLTQEKVLLYAAGGMKDE
jgi:ribose transport system ATP-binding protein